MFIQMNDIPALIAEGKLTRKEAINYIVEFIHKNPALFTLEKESDDFRNDLIIDFLEKGENFLSSFDSSRGNFFPFLYATILGRIKALRKRECFSNIKDSCIYEELLANLSNEENKYEDYKEIIPLGKDYKKPPFAVNRVKAEDIEKFFKKTELTKEIKTILILLFKYAFFIDYDQLKNVCEHTGIDYNFLIEIKDYCMDFLDKKVQEQSKAYETRNRTYFLRKRTAIEIQNIEKEHPSKDDFNSLNYKLSDLHNKYHKQTAKLERDNSDIMKKSSHIVLPDKKIAGFMGLCERQVRYYISKAKSSKLNLLEVNNSENTESD